MHTPGPWVLDDIASLGSIYCSDATGSIVARTTGKGFEYASRSEDEWRSNARLIAAAPELLEALQDMLSGWKYIRHSHGDLYGVGWDRAQEKAEAAISKALGQ